MMPWGWVLLACLARRVLMQAQQTAQVCAGSEGCIGIGDVLQVLCCCWWWCGQGGLGCAVCHGAYGRGGTTDH